MQHAVFISMVRTSPTVVNLVIIHSLDDARVVESRRQGVAYHAVNDLGQKHYRVLIGECPELTSAGPRRVRLFIDFVRDTGKYVLLLRLCWMTRSDGHSTSCR
jgi:hypothetical protein